MKTEKTELNWWDFCNHVGRGERLISLRAPNSSSDAEPVIFTRYETAANDREEERMDIEQAKRVSEAKIQYAELLRKLHQLELDGKSDSDASDDICDAMDTPWSLLSEEDRQEMRDLSTRLWKESDEQKKKCR